MSRYSTVFLDLDGTIFDFQVSQRICFNRAMEAFSIQIPTGAHEIYNRINQYFWRELEMGNITAEELKRRRYERLFEHFGITDKDANAVNEKYLIELSRSAILLPGALEFLRKVYPFFTVYLVTNGIKRSQDGRVYGSPIAPFIHGMVTSEEVHAAKPDPGIFREAMKRADEPDVRKCVMVGDSLSADVAGAQNVGMDAVWYHPEGTGYDGKDPVCVARTYEDVLDFLK